MSWYDVPDGHKLYVDEAIKAAGLGGALVVSDNGAGTVTIGMGTSATAAVTVIDNDTGSATILAVAG